MRLTTEDGSEAAYAQQHGHTGGIDKKINQ
jgi:hypothetical protein